MAFRHGTKPNFVGVVCRSRSLVALLSGHIRSGNINGSGVYQHDRDVVLDGVNAVAFAAFQALAVGIQDHRLLANRANQHVKQILGNHKASIVTRLAPDRTLLRGPWCPWWLSVCPGPSQALSRDGGRSPHAVESPFDSSNAAGVVWQPGFSTEPE